MLVDTRCDQTIMAIEFIDQGKVDYSKTTQVLCVHGHVEFSPTIMFWARTRRRQRWCWH